MTSVAAMAWFPVVDPVLCDRALTDQVLNNTFVFNGERFCLGEGFDWTQNPSRDIEWLILLHKFYYATGLGLAWQETGDRRYASKWIELTKSWMRDVPPDFLPADVTGRRLQNWVSAWYYFNDCALVSDDFRTSFLASIRYQTEWLLRNLTAARNHRTLELLAIFLVSVALPELPESEAWLAFARDAFFENLRADLRPDGVHCEQSTDYHHIVLRNALVVARLARLNGIEMPAGFDDLVQSALEFAVHIHRPDGLIPSLSDGDTASYTSLLRQGYELYGDRRLLWVATRGEQGIPPAERIKEFPDGGYYILRSGWGERERFEDERFIVFDCGPLGEGNHGHFDLLSFELYAGGRPLIIDPGRCTYNESGPVNWRVRFRSTAAHNTVTVDGLNQTRYEFARKKFKVRGPAPKFELLAIGTRAGYDFVRGRAVSSEYDVIHEREIRAYGRSRVVVTDDLRSPSEHEYVQTFQLAPGAERHLAFAGCSDASMEVGEGFVSPAYGERISAPRVTFRKFGSNVRFETYIGMNS